MIQLFWAAIFVVLDLQHLYKRIVDKCKFDASANRLISQAIWGPRQADGRRGKLDSVSLHH